METTTREQGNTTLQDKEEKRKIPLSSGQRKISRSEANIDFITLFGKDRLATLRNILFLLSAVGMLASVILVFFVAPTERQMGVVQRIFYFHVSVAWVGGLGLALNFIFSLAYLIKRTTLWDRLAASAADTAFPFLTMVLITGPLWAKPIWHVWWDWNDMRLTTFAFLWLIFAGYQLVRMSTDSPQMRANLSAALAIFGFADVPVVFFATRWWTTTHPVVFGADTGEVKMGLDGTMLLIFFFVLTVFTILYAFLFLYRLRLTTLEEAVGALESVVQARDDY